MIGGQTRTTPSHECAAIPNRKGSGFWVASQIEKVQGVGVPDARARERVPESVVGISPSGRRSDAVTCVRFQLVRGEVPNLRAIASQKCEAIPRRARIQDS